MHNLLDDKLIRVELDGRGAIEELSLPEVYEALSLDRVDAFTGLRPHQRHAWHAFLSQLAVIALHEKMGNESLHELDAVDWYDALRGLTARYENDEPWQVVANDPTRPAFMQPPSPKGLAEYKKYVFSPDDLDVLVTAKNHEVKQNIAIWHSLDDWVYALVSLQTMAPFSGSGNYGISRMKGGYSSRPCLGLKPGDGKMGTHLFHDIGHMINCRSEVLERYPDYYQEEGGLSLLWLEPWDGATSLSLGRLDPYYIEVCRRVRLCLDGTQVIAKRATSSKPRINAKDANGDLGDHWTPVDRERGWSLSLSAARFHYEKLTELLFRGTFSLPNAMKVSGSGGRSWKLVIRGLAGGQGKTEGYYERTDLAFSGKTVTVLPYLRPKDDSDLASLVRKQLDEVGGIAKALKTGIAVAASGKKELAKPDWQKSTPYIARFHRKVDSFFFSFLDRRYVAEEKGEKLVRREFGVLLVSIAREIFRFAIRSTPCPIFWRYRAQALAVMIFNAELRKSAFSDDPEVFSQQEPKMKTAPDTYTYEES